MAGKQYDQKSFTLLFKFEGHHFQYKLVSSEVSFKGSLLESLLNDKKRFTVGGENFDSQKAFKVRVVLHSHKDFAIGQVSQAEDVATFAQKFFLHGENENDKKKEYLPVVHITLDDSYVYNLYNLCGSIYVGGIFYEEEGLFVGREFVGEEKLTKLREKLPSRISRSYQILDSSIWNKIVPYKSFARRIVNNTGTHDEHIAGGSKGLFDAISEIDANYKRGLYILEVAQEYVNLNARLTLQSFLSGSHASGVSPFIFHSESATDKMINDEFNNKNVGNKSIIDKIKERVWRILLVDDRAFSTMGSGEQSGMKKEDGLYSNCKIKIIKNLLEEQFENIKVEYRSCNKGFKEPALYIWPKEKNNSSLRSTIIKTFESNREKNPFDKSCLYDIKSTIKKQNDLQLSSTTSKSDEGNKICQPKGWACVSEMWQQLVALFGGGVRKSKDADNIEVKEYVEQRLNNEEPSANENQEVIGYKYVGDHLLDIKSIIDEKFDGTFSTQIETTLDDDTQFLIEYAESLDEAEKALRYKEYDFILLDYLLNNEYGYELLDRIYSYTEAERIYKANDWKKIIGALISDAPSQEYDELLQYLRQRKIQEQKKDQKHQNEKILLCLNEINEKTTELKSLIESSNKGNEEVRGKINKLENEISRIIGQILEEDKYIFGPHGRFFFMFISAYTSAVYERLLAEGLNRSEKYWHIAVGACPTNTPKLFLYNLLKLMEKQLEDSGVDRLSPRSIFDIVNKIYGSAEGEDIGKSVRYRANKYYQKVLDLHYLYRKMLDDVDFPANESNSIFNTKGSVLITNFMKKNVNLGGLLEHLTQLVHLTAFGTVRQWPEMWEEYIYFKAQFNITQLEIDCDKQNWSAREHFNKLCVNIENHILDLKSDVK